MNKDKNDINKIRDKTMSVHKENPYSKYIKELEKKYVSKRIFKSKKNEEEG